MLSDTPQASGLTIWLVAAAICALACALAAACLFSKSILQKSWMRAAGAALFVAVGAVAAVALLTLFDPGMQFSQFECILAAFCGACLSIATAPWRLFATRPHLMSALLLIMTLLLAGDIARRFEDVRPIELDLVPASLELTARTDGGTPIVPLEFRRISGSAWSMERRMKNMPWATQAINLSPPDLKCNCFGWVFTNGAFAIDGDVVPAILAENGYRPTTKPVEGDVIIYSTPGTPIAMHAGLVRVVRTDGLILVESKWGAYGRFLHAPEAQPFATQYQYWRSPRRGHLLAGLGTDTSNAPQAGKAE